MHCSSECNQISVVRRNISNLLINNTVQISVESVELSDFCVEGSDLTFKFSYSIGDCSFVIEEFFLEQWHGSVRAHREWNFDGTESFTDSTETDSIYGTNLELHKVARFQVVNILKTSNWESAFSANKSLLTIRRAADFIINEITSSISDPDNVACDSIWML